MKLSDIKKPTLQEALKLEWVFNLHETLNTRFDDESWGQRGKMQVGRGILGDEEFEIYLEPGTFVIDDFTYHFINVAFAKMVNGHPSEKFQATGKNASKIVGAISNALEDRVKLYDYHAIVFFANDNVESRMTVYNKIAQRRWTKLGFGEAFYDIDVGKGRKMTLLVDKNLAKERLDSFIEHLKKLKKL